MRTYSCPAQGAQRTSQPQRLPNQPAVPEAFRPQANAGPSQAPPPQLQIQAPPPQPQVQPPQAKPQYNNVPLSGNYAPKRPISSKRQSYPPLPQSLGDIFQVFMAYNTLRLPKEKESWPAYVDQTKYCPFHRGPGHTIEDCYYFCDYIYDLNDAGKIN